MKLDVRLDVSLKLFKKKKKHIPTHIDQTSFGFDFEFPLGLDQIQQKKKTLGTFVYCN